MYYQKTKEKRWLKKLSEKLKRVVKCIGFVPLIEESEDHNRESAEATFKKLSNDLPNHRIGLVHGKLSMDKKNKAMSDFKEHKLDLLVATTVIEVGVDVPNASMMVIENTERLGLSQLHQLRGRIGRGEHKSFCIMLYKIHWEIRPKRDWKSFGLQEMVFTYQKKTLS